MIWLCAVMACVGAGSLSWGIYANTEAIPGDHLAGLTQIGVGLVLLPAAVILGAWV